MALSTLDLEGNDGKKKLPKKIQPSNARLKIHKIELDSYKFIEGAFFVVMHAETEPIEDFEGFMIDNDESKGRYSGQIGKIKTSQYAFADGQTKTGVIIKRDRAMLLFLQNLCRALDINDWFKAQHNQHAIIEDFIEAFNKTAPFSNKFMDCCVAGKEYTNKDGYTDYNLYLPNADNGRYSFGEIDSDKIIKFDSEKHIVKPKPKEEKSFGEDDLIIPKKTSSDFNLD